MEGCGAIMTGDWFTVTMGAYSSNQNSHINLTHTTAYSVKDLCPYKQLAIAIHCTTPVC